MSHICNSSVFVIIVLGKFMIFFFKLLSLLVSFIFLFDILIQFFVSNNLLKKRKKWRKSQKGITYS
jgi:hypothetical protein